MRTTFHHLAKRGTAGTWYVVLAVPKDLQPRFDGKHHLLTSLKTTDRAVALARRGVALDDLERKIREARNPAKVANIMEAAKVLNQARLEILPGDSSAPGYGRMASTKQPMRRPGATAGRSPKLFSASQAALRRRCTPTLTRGLLNPVPRVGSTNAPRTSGGP